MDIWEWVFPIFLFVNQMLSEYANIRGTSPCSVPNTKMTSGSLTIRSVDVSYGYDTEWSTNTAGIRMACSDITEILVHDPGA